MFCIGDSYLEGLPRRVLVCLSSGQSHHGWVDADDEDEAAED
jgi:hypothetical protein